MPHPVALHHGVRVSDMLPPITPEPECACAQVKHMAGPFFTEGSFTKNSPTEVEALMQNLHNWANGRRPPKEQLLAFDAAKAAVAEAPSKAPAQPLDRFVELSPFMGRWYVVAHIPTFVDRNTTNNTEDYVWNAEKQRIDITFTYSNRQRTKTSTIQQVLALQEPRSALSNAK